MVRPQKNPSEWRVNVTQMKKPDGSAVDGTNVEELSAGEIEGRRQAMEFFNFLKREAPGFGNSYIVDIPPQLGIRETRRITGHYRLTREDVLGCASFADTIGVNGWPIEAHIAGDVEWQWPAIPQSRGFNHLPYRMLVPQKVTNLLVAGRCASMTHEGQSAARVSGGCFVMGQAAGSAAHLALSGNSSLAEIPVEVLQQLLEKSGAYLGRDVD
jgi:FAD-dependent oxidoreductase family protein